MHKPIAIAAFIFLSGCATPGHDQVAFDKRACADDVVNAKANYRAAFLKKVRDTALEADLLKECLARKDGSYIDGEQGGDSSGSPGR